ncbi:MAG TPA: four helix bundle protein [Bacteroidales bacterium]|nr:four helix bundle protein [Bacteroidales bacterium]
MKRILLEIIMGVNSYKELIVYQKAHKLAMEIFELTKSFPKEETYSLTDQIRRSSRSVSSCIAESWAKRRYIKSFVNKLTDSLAEEYETEDWLDYSRDCVYITQEENERLLSEYKEVRKMLISMINNPQKWCS